MILSISSKSFFCVTGAYTCVDCILLCLSILPMVTIGTPASRITSEANE